MAVIGRPIDMNDTNMVLRITGAFISIFSLAVGLLILFAIPIACSFVGSLQLVILGFLFVIGLLTFLLSFILPRTK